MVQWGEIYDGVRKVVESRAILPSGPPPITVPSSLEQEKFWSGNSKLRVKHE